MTSQTMQDAQDIAELLDVTVRGAEVFADVCGLTLNSFDEMQAELDTIHEILRAEQARRADAEAFL